MSRIAFVTIVLFLLPLAIWCAVNFVKRALADTPPQTEFWQDTPLGWLALAGAVLSMGSLAGLALLGEKNPVVEYRAPVIKDVDGNPVGRP